MTLAPKQRIIEQEYGEPFVDVLTGFAAMGYGIDTTARVLGYDTRGFRRLLQRHTEWAISWPALRDQVIMRDREPFTDGARAKISGAALVREAAARAERRRLGVMSETERRAAAKLVRRDPVKQDNSKHKWRW
jgi:hypothetical protein